MKTVEERLKNIFDFSGDSHEEIFTKRWKSIVDFSEGFDEGRI